MSVKQKIADNIFAKKARMPFIYNITEDIMIINHNMSAIFAHTRLKVTDRDLTKDMEKLSSGLRIVRAGDDASGLAVSEKMRAQIRGLRQASQNASNGISFIQVAEGYLQETQDIMHRMRELCVQASNGIYSDEDRMQIQVEISQLVDEVDRIASHAQFNGMNMLTGKFARETGVSNLGLALPVPLRTTSAMVLLEFVSDTSVETLAVTLVESVGVTNHNTPSVTPVNTQAIVNPIPHPTAHFGI